MKKFFITISLLLVLEGFCQIRSSDQVALPSDDVPSDDAEIEYLFQGLSISELMQVIQETDTEFSSLLAFKIPILNPLSKTRLTSNFGLRIHPLLGYTKFHTGIDLAAKLNQAVYAPADGIVSEIGFNNALGRYIRVKHLLGFESVYGHLQGFQARLHQQVYQGQIIGYCGSSGHTTGVHLHYGLLRYQRYINPSHLLCTTSP
jgi:murein DD-endopeptidase MepM/ murein hydrolase activator NlpD